jgi:hypothetical protein
VLLGPDRITAAPQRQRSSAHIPLVRPHALKAPEPLKRGEDVDSAISRVSAARLFGVNEREQIGKKASGGASAYQRAPLSAEDLT